MNKAAEPDTLFWTIAMRSLVLPIIALPFATSLVGLAIGILVLLNVKFSSAAVVVVVLSAVFSVVLGRALFRAYRQPFFFTPSQSPRPALARAMSVNVVAVAYLVLGAGASLIYFFHPLLRNSE